MFGFRKVIPDGQIDILARRIAHEIREKLAAGFQDTMAMLGEREKLKLQVEDLKIEKGRILEEQERRDREIEHKVGLERKRQEFEIDAAKREAILEVREEALEAEREAFEENMEFMQDRFEKEVVYQRELLQDVLKRLPTAEIFADVTKQKPASNRRK